MTNRSLPRGLADVLQIRREAREACYKYDESGLSSYHLESEQPVAVEEVHLFVQQYYLEYGTHFQARQAELIARNSRLHLDTLVGGRENLLSIQTISRAYDRGVLVGLRATRWRLNRKT